MALLIRHTKKGLKDSMKSAGMKLPHGYDIKKRKVTRKRKASKKRK